MFLPLSVCVKSSEVLVSLLSCTINTESVLNLHTTKTDRVSRCLLHLCHVRLVMSVINVLMMIPPPSPFQAIYIFIVTRFYLRVASSVSSDYLFIVQDFQASSTFAFLPFPIRNRVIVSNTHLGFLMYITQVDF